MLDWWPNVEAFDLPDATHLHVQNPRGMAEALAAFFGGRLASGQHNHKRFATRARSEALGALILFVGTAISYLSLPKEEH